MAEQRTSQKVSLLIVDPQNDFCSLNGALSVKFANNDMVMLAEFIDNNSEKLSDITITLDDHDVIHISHPGFWLNFNNEHPEPRTVITSEDVINGVYKPAFAKKTVIEYLTKLEKNSKTHVIWPEHCITGSVGASVYEPIMTAISNWDRKGNRHNVIYKGTCQLAEHYGAFEANVPMPKYSDTILNISELSKFLKYDIIYLAGEAKSHCVAETLLQMLNYNAKFASKIIVLEDCMSDVEGFEDFAKPIYDKAKEMGVKFIKSTDC